MMYYVVHGAPLDGYRHSKIEDFQMNAWCSLSAHYVDKASNFDDQDNFTHEQPAHEAGLLEDIDNEDDGIGKMQKQLEKVLKGNKRGFHRKKASNDEVTSSASNQKDVHFGQGLKKFANAVGGKGYDKKIDIIEETECHTPSTALEGKNVLQNFGHIFQTIYHVFEYLGLLNILCGALLNMPDASIEKACGTRSSQSSMVCFHKDLFNYKFLEKRVLFIFNFKSLVD